MRSFIIPCDHAQCADGKINMIGGGWTVVGPNPTPGGLVVMVMVPWELANQRHRCQVALLDEDRTPALSQGHDGVPQPVFVLDTEFEVGRPPGMPAGTEINHYFAVNFGPLPLVPGRKYFWQIKVNDEILSTWPFNTRPAPKLASL